MTDPKSAVFRIADTGKTIRTHFNPASLQITVSTKLSESKGKKKGSRQVVKEGSAKLSVELVFDTTDTLENVCDKTVEVARLLGEKGKPPPRVEFDWGAFKFTGLVDSFKETLEFFSADGVPLRSAVSLSMTQDEDLYSRGATGQKAAGWSGGGGGGDAAAEVPAPPPGSSTTATATQGGDPAAGRTIAAQNGEESMRFPSSQTLTVDASASLSPPVAFASGGVGFSASGGVGFSASGGVGFSASGGVGFSASGGVGFSAGSAGFGLSASAGPSIAFGSSASAGVTASAGAFAGLRTQATGQTRPTRLDTSRFVQRVEADARATDDGAVFELGGRVKTQGSRLGRSPRARIRFEGE